MKRPIHMTLDFGGLDPTDGEYASVEDFVEYLCDDDRDTFDWRNLNCLSAGTGLANGRLRAALEGYGLTLEERGKVKHIRGFNANGNDRWYGPGSCKSHGGSGGDQIMGLAGRAG